MTSSGLAGADRLYIALYEKLCDRPVTKTPEAEHLSVDLLQHPGPREPIPLESS